MSHGTHRHEPRGIWRTDVTRLNESCQTYAWVMAHMRTSHVTHIWMSHVTHLSKAWHTYTRAPWRMNDSCRLYVWLSHVLSVYEWAISCMCMKESCRVSRVWMSHGTHLHEPCGVWISHVVSLCIIESCPVYIRMSHVVYVYEELCRVSRVWMSHSVSLCVIESWSLYTNGVCLACEWVISCIKYNESCFAYASRRHHQCNIWMRHVTDINESWYTYARVMWSRNHSCASRRLH